MPSSASSSLLSFGFRWARWLRWKRSADDGSSSWTSWNESEGEMVFRRRGQRNEPMGPNDFPLDWIERWSMRTDREAVCREVSTWLSLMRRCQKTICKREREWSALFLLTETKERRESGVCRQIKVGKPVQSICNVHSLSPTCIYTLAGREERREEFYREIFSLLLSLSLFRLGVIRRGNCEFRRVCCLCIISRYRYADWPAEKREEPLDRRHVPASVSSGNICLQPEFSRQCAVTSGNDSELLNLIISRFAWEYHCSARRVQIRSKFWFFLLEWKFDLGYRRQWSRSTHRMKEEEKKKETFYLKLRWCDEVFHSPTSAEVPISGSLPPHLHANGWSSEIFINICQTN